VAGGTVRDFAFVIETNPLEVRVKQLVDGGDLKGALKVLERARREAAAEEDVNALWQVFEASRTLQARALERNQRHRAGEIAGAARQNIRFLSRRQALTAGEEWVDPFQGSVPVEPGQVATPETRGRRNVRGRVRWGALAVWAILMVGTAWALGGTSGSPATWFAVDAGSGAIFGVLFILFVCRRDETDRGFTDVVGFLVGGAVLYSTVYGIAIIAAGHGYNSNEDPNGTVGAVVWFGLCWACLIPMLLTAGLVDRVRR
jgi:hypothetical protein